MTSSEIPGGEEEGEDISEDAGDLGETPNSAASRVSPEACVLSSRSIVKSRPSQD